MSFTFFLPSFSFTTFFFFQGTRNSGVISLPVNRILFEVAASRIKRNNDASNYIGLVM